jgi:NitT/TauT family transport system permease protein
MHGLKRIAYNMHGMKRIAIVLGVVVALICVWQWFVVHYSISPIILPSPIATFREFLDSPGFFLSHAGWTLWLTIVGFMLALLFGVILSFFIVSSRLAENTIYTLLVALNSVPKVALAPLFIVWMGVGPEPKIAISLMLAIFPIVIDTVLGLKSVDGDMVALARVNAASRWAILSKIRLPSALPSVFAGMKVAISLSLIGTIIGEFVGGSKGLGFAILTAQGQFDTPRLFVSIMLLAIMGFLLFSVMELIERLVIPWHTSVRKAH